MTTDLAHAADKLPTITVHAANRAYHNCIVAVPVSLTAKQKAHSVFMLRRTPRGGRERGIRARVDTYNGQTRLVFILPDLPQGVSQTYSVSEEQKHPVYSSDASVLIEPTGSDLNVLTQTTPDGKPTLFTRYTTHSGPNKPFFYPILTPDGHHLTRQWPMEMNPNETHDHPHHRGLWFTHGDLNGIDFWSEQVTDKVKPGKTVARGFENVVSGPIFGGFRTRTEWRAPDDKLIATDVRDIRVYQVGKDRIMDFELTIKPEEGLLVWGDTKEGMFGLRVTDTLAPKPDRSAHIDMPTGHMESASGLKDGAIWGKPNAWVDYYGPVEGKTYGVAIFDDTQNLRHPQTWHARDYGLFAVNPFGWHDFGLGAKGAGTYTQPADQTLTFRYRLLFHEGDTTEGHVAEQYHNYTDPPEIEVK
jgi:hypothetical protein